MRIPGRKKDTAEAAPRHVEIWGEIEASNRFLRVLAVATTAWAFVALAGSAYAVHVALTRPLAFAVESDGHASPVGRLGTASAVTLPEVRYVAKEFLRRHIAVNSLTIESDLASAANLMTAELQAENRQMLDAYERDHGREFVTYVREQQIQMSLELDDEKAEVREHDGVFTVKLVGVARTLPLSRVGEDSAFVEREIEAHLTLVRCPRTEATPNGLLVAKVASRFYVREAPEPDRAQAAEEEPEIEILPDVEGGQADGGKMGDDQPPTPTELTK